VASIAGYAAATALVWVSNSLRVTTFEGMWDDAVGLLILGSAMGLPQWLVLRQHLSKAGWWVLASALGMVGYLVGVANPASTLTEIILRVVIVGALSGAITGIALVWLLRQPAKERPTSSNDH